MTIYHAPTTRARGSPDAYALLALMLRTEYGLPLPEITKTPAGKPYFPACPGLHFSISHTDTRVLCAAAAFPIGADIQDIRTLRPGVAERVCTAEELAQFDFFDLWTLKESYIKLYGGTLGDMRRAVFSRRGGAIVAPDPGVAARVFSGGEIWRAAVCVAGGADFPIPAPIWIPEIPGGS